eukprot:15473337-Alexandrium_andersonii.AAC.1
MSRGAACLATVHSLMNLQTPMLAPRHAHAANLLMPMSSYCGPSLRAIPPANQRTAPAEHACAIVR